MTEQLKPCPFCGNARNIGMRNEKHNHSGGYFISCPECDASTGLRYAMGDDPRPLLIEAWNRRAQPAQAVPLLSDDFMKEAALEAFGCTWDADDETLVNKYGHGVYLWRFIDFARAIEQAVLAKRVPMTEAQWIACEDKMPEPGTECLVHVKALSTKQNGPTHYTHIDTWDEQREAPVSWSSATIPVGLGWGSFDFEDVTHWMPLPPPPGIVGKEGA